MHIYRIIYLPYNRTIDKIKGCKFMKEVYNYMEILVEEKLNTVLNTSDALSCKCYQCKKNIYALALNNLKPFYVVSCKGKIIARYEEKLSNLDADVLVAITNAIKTVTANPYHDNQGEVY